MTIEISSFMMSIPCDINTIFNINEDINKINLDISDNNIDNTLDFILDLSNNISYI